jgi:predicted phosphoadenosine phosphosulfate sulfurtransferase
VRTLPDQALGAGHFDFFRPDMWDYDFQEEFSSWQHRATGARKTCVLVGIRAQESLNRWRTIASDRNINKYKGKAWTTKIDSGIYNAYPIYDWETEDIWTANARFAFPYNHIYDLMYMAGVPLHRQRVASPFLSAAQDALKLYRAIDPDVWGRMVSRVNGVNFTAIYGGTKAMGWKRIEKPPHFTWREYMDFLLGTLPAETAANYQDKLATSIKFWRQRGGVLSERAIIDLRMAGVEFEVGEATNYKTDKLPVRMDYIDDIDSDDFPLIPTYKRMCVCILKNDHLCKYMGFTLTKCEQTRRKAAIEKYSKL